MLEITKHTESKKSLRIQASTATSLGNRTGNVARMRPRVCMCAFFFILYSSIPLFLLSDAIRAYYAPSVFFYSARHCLWPRTNAVWRIGIVYIVWVQRYPSVDLLSQRNRCFLCHISLVFDWVPRKLLING